MSFYIRKLQVCEHCSQPATVEVVGPDGSYGKFCVKDGAAKLKMLKKAYDKPMPVWPVESPVEENRRAK